MKVKFKYAGILLVSFFLVTIQTAEAQRGRKGQRPSPETIINRLDTNDDGLIDKREAQNALRGRLYQNFELIDVNKDGLVSLEELQNRSKRRSRNCKRK